MTLFAADRLHYMITLLNHVGIPGNWNNRSYLNVESKIISEVDDGSNKVEFLALI